MPSIFKQYNVSPKEDTIQIPDWEEALYKEETDQQDILEDADEFAEFTEFQGQQVGESAETQAEDETTIVVPLTKEEIAVHYAAELQELYLDSQQRGYADGLLRKKGELGECVKRVDEQLAKMQELQVNYMKRYGEELKYLAIEVAEKMILQKVEADDWILEKLVMKNVRDVKKASWIDVEVSERLVNLVESMKIELDKPEYHGRASVMPTASPLDTCRITTEEGTVVASISEQARNLREAYRTEGKRQ